MNSESADDITKLYDLIFHQYGLNVTKNPHTNRLEVCWVSPYAGVHHNGKMTGFNWRVVVNFDHVKSEEALHKHLQYLVQQLEPAPIGHTDVAGRYRMLPSLFGFPVLNRTTELPISPLTTSFLLSFPREDLTEETRDKFLFKLYSAPDNILMEIVDAGYIGYEYSPFGFNLGLELPMWLGAPNNFTIIHSDDYEHLSNPTVKPSFATQQLDTRLKYIFDKVGALQKNTLVFKPLGKVEGVTYVLADSVLEPVETSITGVLKNATDVTETLVKELENTTAATAGISAALKMATSDNEAVAAIIQEANDKYAPPKNSNPIGKAVTELLDNLPPVEPDKELPTDTPINVVNSGPIKSIKFSDLPTAPQADKSLSDDPTQILANTPIKPYKFGKSPMGVPLPAIPPDHKVPIKPVGWNPSLNIPAQLLDLLPLKPEPHYSVVLDTQLVSNKIAIGAAIQQMEHKKQAVLHNAAIHALEHMIGDPTTTSVEADFLHFLVNETGQHILKKSHPDYVPPLVDTTHWSEEEKAAFDEKYQAAKVQQIYDSGQAMLAEAEEKTKQKKLKGLKKSVLPKLHPIIDDLADMGASYQQIVAVVAFQEKPNVEQMHKVLTTMKNNGMSSQAVIQTLLPHIAPDKVEGEPFADVSQWLAEQIDSDILKDMEAADAFTQTVSAMKEGPIPFDDE